MKLRHLTAIFIIGVFFFLIIYTQIQDGTPGEEGFDTRIYGAWNRTATLLDGADMGTDPASTIFNEDGRYLSTGNCTINGAYMIVDDVLTCTIDSHDCEGYNGPYEFNSTFRISEDGEALTIDTNVSGSVVTETFVRATD